MKVNITGRNVKPSDYLKETIEKKVLKLEKYFHEDITADVVLSEEKKYKKTEVTIRAKNTIFRAEAKAEEFYDGIDTVVEKLSKQMTRFKGKLQHRQKDTKTFAFEHWPEAPEEEEIRVTKTKKFELSPMTVDEAILQMELLQHNFYVFLNMETDAVNVVYKRNENHYGLLETTY